MKYSAVAGVAITLWLSGCSSDTPRTSEQPKQEEQPSAILDSLIPPGTEKPAQKISGTVADSLLGHLCRKWYSKKFVVDGQEQAAAEVLNKEDLTLRRDMTFFSVNHDLEDTLAGTWQIVNARTIELTDSTGEAHQFALNKLSNKELVLKVLDSDEEDIVIHYGSVE